MQIDDIRELLRDKRVIEEINRHLWIESQKAGYSIGIERATDEWLALYAQGWMKYHKPEKWKKLQNKKKKPRPNMTAAKSSFQKSVKKRTAGIVKTTAARKTARKTPRKKAAKRK